MLNRYLPEPTWNSRNLPPTEIVKALARRALGRDAAPITNDPSKV